MLVKPRLAEKHKSLCHGLVFELLLHDKEKFRMFLRMNTDTYEISKFVLVRWGDGEGETSPTLNLVEQSLP